MRTLAAALVASTLLLAGPVPAQEAPADSSVTDKDVDLARWIEESAGDATTASS